MRPRRIAADNALGIAQFMPATAASMRPRRIAADNTGGANNRAQIVTASMRPRRIAADNPAVRVTSMAGQYRFNEAAANRRG